LEKYIPILEKELSKISKHIIISRTGKEIVIFRLEFCSD
jgi:hypothetical protein